MHAGQRHRISHDHKIHLEARILDAEFDARLFHHQPEALFRAILQVEADDQPPVGHLLQRQELLPAPEHDPGIIVNRRQLEPARPPDAQLHADLCQLLPRSGQLVPAPAPTDVARRGDDASALQRTQPLREQRPRHPRDSLMDLGEGVALQVEVSDHQRRPALRQDLGRFRDRAVIAVAATHADSVTVRPAISSPFFVLDAAAASREHGHKR